MKYLKYIIACVISFGLVSGLKAQTPDVYSNPLAPYNIPSSSMQYRSFGRIWIEKSMDQTGYKLTIHTSGDIDPASIQVNIVGHSILIENKQSFQKEDRNDHGFYSYSRSSSNFRRRFSIPRNADTDHMMRSEENGIITITLPFLFRYPDQ